MSTKSQIAKLFKFIIIFSFAKLAGIQQKMNDGITVFIHGTMLPLHSYLIHKVDCPFGLTNGKHLTDKYPLSRIGHILHAVDPVNFDINYFHLFGWSGRLGFGHRESAANDLYQCLRNFKAPITLITHSHGGNVVLNLAKIAADNDDKEFKIEKLIMLACPVQHATSKYVSSPIFKKIISLYSEADLTQIIDPQGLYSKALKRFKRKNRKISIFSQRRFPPADNLIQIKVRLNDNDPWHLDFRREPFLKHLPQIVQLLDTYEIQLLSKAKNKIYLCDNKDPRLKIKIKKNRRVEDRLWLPFDNIY